MAFVRRLVLRGRNLTISVPRVLARELAMVHRQHVVIQRAPGRALHVRLLDLEDDDALRRAARPALRHSAP